MSLEWPGGMRDGVIEDWIQMNGRQDNVPWEGILLPTSKQLWVEIRLTGMMISLLKILVFPKFLLSMFCRKIGIPFWWVSGDTQASILPLRKVEPWSCVWGGCVVVPMLVINVILFWLVILHLQWPLAKVGLEILLCWGSCNRLVLSALWALFISIKMASLWTERGRWSEQGPGPSGSFLRVQPVVMSPQSRWEFSAQVPARWRSQWTGF